MDVDKPTETTTNQEPPAPPKRRRRNMFDVKPEGKNFECVSMQCFY